MIFIFSGATTITIAITIELFGDMVRLDSEGCPTPLPANR